MSVDVAGTANVIICEVLLSAASGGRKLYYNNTDADAESKKKGLSLEEKRTRMMEIFFESKDVFQLKDIEKIAPKTKGITPMSVKDVLQSLVDDNMVDCERVGTSNYYWAFPSKALHARKRKLEELQSQTDGERVVTPQRMMATRFLGQKLNDVEQQSVTKQRRISESKQRQVSVQKAVEKEKVGRQDTKERSSLLKELQALREERTQLQAELEKYRECDPEVVEEMRKSNVVAKEAVSRWTDNVFSIKSWTKKKFSFDDSRINKAFGIPEDFDYMD